MNDNNVRVRFGSKDGLTIFRLDPLTHSISLSHFSCPVEEYNDWLFQDASSSQNDHIARTWLLRERATGSIAAYMSLIMDATHQWVYMRSALAACHPSLGVEKLSVR